MRTILLAVLACVSVAGCGGGDEKHVQSEREALDGVLSSFSDQAPNSKTLKVYFTDGKAPDAKALRAYQGKMFSTADEPAVADAKATIKVTVADEKTGKNLGPFEWTFAKDGDKWKIESAPLE